MRMQGSLHPGSPQMRLLSENVCSAWTRGTAGELFEWAKKRHSLTPLHIQLTIIILRLASR